MNFVAIGNSLLNMVSRGAFPIPEAGTDSKRGAPRANDGLVRLDQSGRVLFASPNALSMFNRAGVEGDLEGRLFAESITGLDLRQDQLDEGLPLILTAKGAWRTDLEFEDVTIAVRSIPLYEAGKRFGGVVLCRDVTELRVRERALLTKDMTIREIHHRVKNNLQTVASLLRIQSRQSDSEEVKESLAQAMRRVSAIAVVHDVLSEGIEQERAKTIMGRSLLEHRSHPSQTFGHKLEQVDIQKHQPPGSNAITSRASARIDRTQQHDADHGHTQEIAREDVEEPHPLAHADLAGKNQGEVEEVSLAPAAITFGI